MTTYRIHEEHWDYQGSDPNAPLFVLLHGFGASTFTWREVTAELAKLGEVWAYDRPGFGFTERPTKWTGTNPYSVAGQLELLEERVLEVAHDRPVIVIGHSAGGQIATYFAATHPLMVAGLVLISPAMVAAGAPEPIAKLFRNRLFDAVGPKLVSKFVKAGMRILETSVHDKEFLTEDVVAGYQAPLKNEDWTVVFWQFVRTPQPRDQKEAIAKTACPTLVITGDDDRVVPTLVSRLLAPTYPNSRYVEISGAGHLCHEEKPAEFMDAVRQNLPWLLRK